MPKVLNSYILALIGSLYVVAPSQAQTINLKKAVELASVRSTSVLSAREKINESEATVSQAYSTAMPTISASSSWLANQDALTSASPLFGGSTYNLYTFSIDASQPILVGGTLWASINAGHTQKDITSLDLKMAERDLREQVIASFHSVLLAKARLETMRKIEKIQRELLATAERRYRIGNEQALSVLQIKTSLSLLLPQVSEAENTLVAATANLATLLGLEKSSNLYIKGNLNSPGFMDLEEMRTNKNPSIRAELIKNRLVQDQLDDLKTVQMAKHWPSLYLVGSWGRAGTQRADLFDGDASSWYAGIKLTVPLFTGLSSFHERRLLNSQISQSRIEEKRLSDQLTLAQTQSKSDLHNAIVVLDASQKALQQAQESVSMANKTYRLGTSTYLQVSDAQRQLANAELAFEQAQYNKIIKLSQYYKSFDYPMDSLIAALEKTHAENRGSP